MTTQPSKPALLRIPLELRYQINNHLVTNPSSPVELTLAGRRSITRYKAPAVASPLTLVCKRLHEELREDKRHFTASYWHPRNPSTDAYYSDCSAWRWNVPKQSLAICLPMVFPKASKFHFTYLWLHIGYWPALSTVQPASKWHLTLHATSSMDPRLGSDAPYLAELNLLGEGTARLEQPTNLFGRTPAHFAQMFFDVHEHARRDARYIPDGEDAEFHRGLLTALRSIVCDLLVQHGIEIETRDWEAAASWCKMKRRKWTRGGPNGRRPSHGKIEALRLRTVLD